jgi:glycosyl-4,4'-diaponeurosporenoate acyltransferase
MRILYLPTAVNIAIIIIIWFVIHMGGAYLGMRLPESMLNAEYRLYRPQKWERNGRLYEKVFRIRRWKGYLPDGGSWMKGGFSKRRLCSQDEAYLEKFVVETCRAELTHWLTFLPAFLFFLIVDWWVALILIFYGLVVNLPCIMTQRYNRIRMLRILEKGYKNLTT